MFIRLPKVFIDGDYYYYYIISFYFCPLFFFFIIIIIITMITVFIITIFVVIIIIIIQGKDDTKLNKEINGWSQTDSAESFFLKVSFTGEVDQLFLTITL